MGNGFISTNVDTSCLGSYKNILGADQMDIRTEEYLQKAYDYIKLVIENDKFEGELSPYDVQILKIAMKNIARVM